jgi:ABC-type phosphate transport system substrate-binding protein
VKTSRLTGLVLFVVLFAAPCFAHHMAVVVSKQNPMANITSAQLGKIFRAEVKKWPDGKYVALVLHRASAGETITLRHLNKMSPQQLRAWIDEHKDLVKFVDSDDEVLSYVESTPGAIGLVDVRSVTDRVNIVRVDGRVPMEEGYLPH